MKQVESRGVQTVFGEAPLKAVHWLPGRRGVAVDAMLGEEPDDTGRGWGLLANEEAVAGGTARSRCGNEQLVCCWLDAGRDTLKALMPKSEGEDDPCLEDNAQDVASSSIESRTATE